MARAGRVAELVVSALEQHLGGDVVTVRSPDFLPGHDSGTDREIDVTLRCRAGSTEVLVIIECRDRASAQDVQWIDSIKGKLRDVRADKAVAVSTSGFTRAAVRSAQSAGIELRTLATLDPAKDLASWITVKHLQVVRRSLEISACSADLKPEELPDEHAARFYEQIAEQWKPHFLVESEKRMMSTAPIYTDEKGQPFSANDLWREIPPSLWDVVPDDGTIVPVRLTLELWKRYSIVTRDFDVAIKAFVLDLDLWHEVENIPAAAVRSYQDGPKTVAETVEFRGEFSGNGEQVFLLTCVPDPKGMTAGLALRNVETASVRALKSDAGLVIFGVDASVPAGAGCCDAAGGFWSSTVRAPTPAAMAL